MSTGQRCAKSGGWRADKLEPVVVEHIRAVVENPEGVLEGMRRDMAGDGAGLGRRIGALKGQLRKKEIEADTLTLQRSKGLIRQGAYERLLAPMNLVLERLENEVALLIQQKGEMENKELYEEQVRAVLMRYRANLDNLDGFRLPIAYAYGSIPTSQRKWPGAGNTSATGRQSRR